VGNGEGGAINMTLVPIALESDTFSGNSGPGGGGTIFDFHAPLTAGGTIVAGSPAGGNCSFFGGSVTDHGYNLTDGRGNCGLNNGTTDLINSNPQLAALADNGGPAQTMAIPAGSPAIDAVPSASGLCPSTDCPDLGTLQTATPSATSARSRRCTRLASASRPQ
jgi:hypothetical protein